MSVIVSLDVLSSNKDGVNVLKDINKYNCFIMIPLENGHFIKNYNNCNSHEHLNIEQHIKFLLYDLGIPSRLSGYTYIYDGVKIAIDDKSILESVTKHLYPAIGKLHNKNPTSIERAIRHALESAWNNGCEQSYNKIFSFSKNKRPTNREFFNTIIDYLNTIY